MFQDDAIDDAIEEVVVEEEEVEENRDDVWLSGQRRNHNCWAIFSSLLDKAREEDTDNDTELDEFFDLV